MGEGGWLSTAVTDIAGHDLNSNTFSASVQDNDKHPKSMPIGAGASLVQLVCQVSYAPFYRVIG